MNIVGKIHSLDTNEFESFHEEKEEITSKG